MSEHETPELISSTGSLGYLAGQPHTSPSYKSTGLWLMAIATLLAFGEQVAGLLTFEIAIGLVTPSAAICEIVQTLKGVAK